MTLTADQIIKYLSDTFTNDIKDKMNEDEELTPDSVLSSFHQAIKMTNAYNSGAKLQGDK